MTSLRDDEHLRWPLVDCHGLRKHERVLNGNSGVTESMEQEGWRGGRRDTVLRRQLVLQPRARVGANEVVSRAFVRIVSLKGDDGVREDAKVKTSLRIGECYGREMAACREAPNAELGGAVLLSDVLEGV